MLRFASRILLLLVLIPPSCGGTRRVAVPRAEFWGFTAPWDPRSAESVARYGERLDAIVSGWIALDSATGRPISPSLFPDTSRLEKRTTRRMAMVTTWHGDRFHAKTIRRLAADPALLSNVASSVATQAAAARYSGLILDFETLEPSDLGAQLSVIRAITDSAHARGIRPITVAIPAEDTAAYPAGEILASADLVLVMLYDQHWMGSEAGPISAPEWVRNALETRIREAGASRIVAGLPAYGYRWIRGKTTEILSYADAQRIAGDALRRDSATHTLRAVGGSEWELWVTDATLLDSLVKQTRKRGVSRFALWRLGQEDATIWSTVVP